MKVSLTGKYEDIIEVAIEGRIDFNNATEFSDEINEIIQDSDDLSLVVDFEKLEYVTSAGLRVFMKLAQSRKKIIKLKNVSDEIYEIFDITGLRNIFDMSKSIKEFDVTGYKKIGEGVSGAVYKISQELIVKMYKPHITLELAEKERNASKESFLKGVPTAIPYEIIQKDGCYGVKYELMNGMTLGEAFTTMPEKYDELVSKYVELAKTIKDIEIEEGRFENIGAIILRYLENMKPYLEAEDYEITKELVELLPVQNRFVHSDLHPGNIMLQNDELIIIDMADVSTGWEFFDLTQVYNDIRFAPHLVGLTEAVEESMGMKQSLMDKVWDSFIVKYYGIADETELAKKTEMIKLASSPIIVSRLGATPDAFRPIMAKLIKEVLIDPVIRPNIDRIKDIYAKADLS